MADSYTVRTHKSWGSRLKGSFRSMIFGLVLFVAAFPIIFCNEGRAVRTARSLEEGAGAVTSVSADLVDPSMDGKLVHMSGASRTDAVLTDSVFGVSASAIKLVREVELFQWRESSSSTSEKNVGGSEDTTTTYSYEKVWSSRLIDSTDFKQPDGHQNPSAMPYASGTEVADRVTVGAFVLPSSMVAALSDETRLSLDRVPGSIDRPVTIHDGGLYLGSDPGNPAVGDARVRFSVVEPGIVSLVAQQQGDTFRPYQTRAGNRISMIDQSMRSAENMFETAMAANTVLTWALRFLSFVMMFLGLAIVFKPLSVLGDVVPMVGNLLGAGTGVAAAVLALFFSVGTIAVSWVLVRPWLGISLGVVAIAALFWALRRGRRRRAALAGSQPTPPLPPIPG